MKAENSTMVTAKKVAVCNTCTIQLVRLAYRRAPWFRLIREPLRLGMCAMAWWHRIDPDRYLVRTPTCHGCTRLYKNALREESAAFRWLNNRGNPLFDGLLEHIVTPGEIQAAKVYAGAASAGNLPEGQELERAG